MSMTPEENAIFESARACADALTPTIHRAWDDFIVAHPKEQDVVVVVDQNANRLCIQPRATFVATETGIDTEPFLEPASKAYGLQTAQCAWVLIVNTSAKKLATFRFIRHAHRGPTPHGDN